MTNSLSPKYPALKVLGFILGGIVLGALGTSAIFVTKDKQKPVDVSSAMGTPLFEVDSKVYTTTSLPKNVAMDYYMLENNIFNARQNFAEQTALRIALARDAKKTDTDNEIPKLDELLPTPPISDTEAQSYYNQIVAQMGVGVFGGMPFDKVKDQLKKRMEQQKQSQLISIKEQELKSAKRITFLEKPPVSPAIDLDVSHFPTRGNKTSPTTLVEVADFLCPHCRESKEIVDKLAKEFSSQVRFVHVSYPLAPESLSGSLARGAFCANKLNPEKFWAYSDKAFEIPWSKNQAPANQPPMPYFDSVTEETATQVGYDAPSFKNCLNSPEAQAYIKEVQTMFKEGKGFQGTPTFYLNNRLIVATPEQLESTIRSALNVSDIK